MILIFVFIIVFSALTIIFVKFWSSIMKKKTKINQEHFNDGARPAQQNQSVQPVRQTDEAKEKTRLNNAIQSCDYLRPTSPDIMSGSSQDQMRRVLDGHRINIYKPEADDTFALERMNKLKDYCYMYNDKENDMKDYMLYADSNNGCTMNNPIFKDTPFISNVFSTLHKDSTHAIPLEKCVMEIDRTQATPENLNAYWEKWGTSKCSSITNPLRDQLADYVDKNNKLSNEIAEYVGLISQYEPQYNAASSNYTQCERETTEDTASLGIVTGKYNDAYDKYQDNIISEKEHQEKKQNKNDDIEVLEKEKERYSGLYQEYRGKNDTCQDKLQKCRERKDNLQDKEKEKEKYLRNVKYENNVLEETENDVSAQLLNVIRNNAVCQSDLNTTNKDYEDLQENYRYERTVLDICIQEEDEYIRLYDKFEKDANEMMVKEEGCIEDRLELRAKNNKCADQKNRCNYLQKSHENAHLRLKEIKDKYDVCDEKRQENLSTKQNLEDINVDLYNDLEQAMVKAYENEKSIYKNEHDQTMKVSSQIIDNYRKKMIEFNNKKIDGYGCKENADSIKKIHSMEADNAELRYKIEAFKKQACHYCKPTVQQCANKFPQEDVLCYEVMQQ